jgi:hypothetical protein
LIDAILGNGSAAAADAGANNAATNGATKNGARDVEHFDRGTA